MAITKHFSMFAFVVLLCIGSVHAATVFSDDMESGTFSDKWAYGNGLSAGYGPVAYDSADGIVYAGAASLKVNGTYIGNEVVNRSDSFFGTVVSVRVYDDGASANSQACTGVGFGTAGLLDGSGLGNSGNFFGIRWCETDANYDFRDTEDYVGFSNGGSYNTGIVRSAGWHEVVVRAGADGNMTVSLDGTAIHSRMVNMSTWSAAEMALSLSSGTSNTGSYTHITYFDNVQMDTICVPDWSCSSFDTCLNTNVSACLAVSDANVCGESFAGALSDYDNLSCGYVEPCVPSWSCSSFDTCLNTNVSACLAVSDANVCGESFGGSLSTYDNTSCGYVVVRAGPLNPLGVGGTVLTGNAVAAQEGGVASGGDASGLSAFFARVWDFIIFWGDE